MLWWLASTFVVEAKKPILEFAEERKLVKWTWWGTTINIRLNYVSTFSSSEGLFWWWIDGLKKNIFALCANQNLRDTASAFEMKIHLVTHSHKWKSPPPLIKHSGKDELNLLYPTANITADREGVTRDICILPVFFTNPSVCFGPGFFLAVRAKTGGWKNCTCLILCRRLVRVVQESSFHVWFLMNLIFNTELMILAAVTL